MLLFVVVTVGVAGFVVVLLKLLPPPPPLLQALKASIVAVSVARVRAFWFMAYPFSSKGVFKLVFKVLASKRLAGLPLDGCECQSEWGFLRKSNARCRVDFIYAPCELSDLSKTVMPKSKTSAMANTAPPWFF